jgi:hypothetical protein
LGERAAQGLREAFLPGKSSNQALIIRFFKQKRGAQGSREAFLPGKSSNRALIVRFTK